MNLSDLKKFVNKVRVSGRTIKDLLSGNKKANIDTFQQMWKGAILGDLSIGDFSENFDKLAKRRNRATLATLKNIMASSRGQLRALRSIGKKGYWENVGIFDSAQTGECASYLGKTWKLPYKDIPNKPPRVSRTPHPCRSYLNFVAEGEEPIGQGKFVDMWNESDDDSKLDLLGKSRFEAYKKGEIKITSFAQYEKTQLFTLEELGLK